MESIWSIVSEYTPYAISIVAMFLAIEQILYLKKKRFVPGPTLVLPFIGNGISLIRNPTRFWDKQSALAKSTPVGISSNYVVGKFIVYIHSTELSHKVFANVRPDAFQLIGYPFGKTMFGDQNLLYMFGQEHKDLRGLIAPNFTPKALAAYVSIQQAIIVKHLRSWIEAARGKSIALRSLVREMNLETSQRVFVGPYLAPEAVERFNVDYDLFTVGLMTLPFGFAFRNAKMAVRRLVDTLEECAGDSKERMGKGEDPTCMIDFWMQENLTEEGLKSSVKYTHKEAGSLLFNFLQAAQDASTSSLLWAIVFLDSHPDVLRRVRLEVLNLWSSEAGVPSITTEQLREMRFTEAVAREALRMRPPAPMLPHSAKRDFALTETYVIPKGTIVFPSIFDSSLQGFPEADRFDPDRFMEERQEDRVYKRNFLVFGAGAHQCVGQRYAMNHLMLFIALFSTLVDFKRDTTDGCDEMVYDPTIVPKDGCAVFLSQRSL